jgi:transposase
MTVSMTDHSPKIEVITSVQRRRRWSAAEKMRMVEGTYQPGGSTGSSRCACGVSPNSLHQPR